MYFCRRNNGNIEEGVLSENETSSKLNNDSFIVTMCNSTKNLNTAFDNKQEIESQLQNTITCQRIQVHTTCCMTCKMGRKLNCKK